MINRCVRCAFLCGDDITSYIFDESNQWLYVATSGIYGKAGVYKLNLINRTYKRLVIVDPEPVDSSEGYYMLGQLTENNLKVAYFGPMINFKKDFRKLAEQ